MTTEPLTYAFIAADAARAMGMPPHPRLADLSICILIDGNGFITVGTSCPTDSARFDAEIGADVAQGHAFSALQEARNYAERDHMTYSPALASAIRLEKAGLPAGRYDVNPTSVPALTVPPDGFTMARSADYPLSDGLVDPIDVSMAWDEVRAQVAEADPPFPGALLGYTVERVTGGGEVVEGENGPETTTGTEAARLTVYA